MLKRTTFLFLVSVLCTHHLFAQNTIILKQGIEKIKISRDIYGQFAEHLGHGIYEGVWVGKQSTIPNTRGIRNDVVKALKEAKIPLIRWPGGCFADEYHWMDGVGIVSKRPSMLNTNWGGVTEDNSFGTHEFMDLCEQIGAQAYITGNLGSGTVREMSQWVEYLISSGESPMTKLRKENGREKPWKVKFWGLGNESWGCGGNMQPSFYASEMKRYSSFCKDYDGHHLSRIAVGPNSEDYNWTDVLMREAAGNIDGLSLHYYTITNNWDHKGSATKFNKSDWMKTMFQTVKMEQLLKRHSEIMDKYDPKKRVGLMVDEWGNWFDVEPGTNPGFLYQQNTIRDAVVAATNLNLFNNHADRVKMSAIAQMVNVLQALVLTHGKDIVLTPTYFVYKMYAVHQDAELIALDLKSELIQIEGIEIQKINASASRDSAGRIHISICNLDPEKPASSSIDMSNIPGVQGLHASGSIISSAGLNDFNDFKHPERIKEKEFSAFSQKNKKLELIIPPRSVVTLEIK